MEIKSLSFSHDNSKLTLSCDRGFAVYSLNPPTLINKSTFQGQATNLAQAVPDSQTVVFSGTKDQSSFKDTSVCAFDYQQQRINLEIECADPIKKIVSTAHYFAVTSNTKMKLYRYNPPSLVLQHVFAKNEHAPVDIIELSDVNIRVALCGNKSNGELKITSYPSVQNDEIVINAANHPLSAIKFCNVKQYLSKSAENKDAGPLIATASAHGTLIRIFDSKSGAQIRELRRGSFSAHIYSLSFAQKNQFIAVYSSTGTIHIFDLVNESARSVIVAKMEAEEGIISFIDNQKLALVTKSGKLQILNVHFDIYTIEKGNVISLQQL